MTINENDLSNPTLPEVATVTVKAAVDGTVKRKARGKNKPKPPPVDHVKVDPRIMDAAKGICLPSQRLKIVSAMEVWVINR